MVKGVKLKNYIEQSNNGCKLMFELRNKIVDEAKKEGHKIVECMDEIIIVKKKGFK